MILVKYIYLFALIDGKAIGILFGWLVSAYIIVIVMAALRLVSLLGLLGKYVNIPFSAIRWVYIYGMCGKLMHWYTIYI